MNIYKLRKESFFPEREKLNFFLEYWDMIEINTNFSGKLLYLTSFQEKNCER